MKPKLRVIINPASGQEYPILAKINKVLKRKFDWEVKVTRRRGEARDWAKEAVEEGIETVAVYGGDGTVMEVAEGLYKSESRMVILPGGTANVLARELGVKLDAREALIDWVEGIGVETQIDMAWANEELFLLRLNWGLLAEVSVNASRESKEKLGKLAYLVSSLEGMLNQEERVYRLELDGKIEEVKGVGLTILNAGNMGLGQLKLVADCHVADGLLEVMLVKQADLGTLLEYARGVVEEWENGSKLTRWRARRVVVESEDEEMLIRDDVEMVASRVDVKVLPRSLWVWAGEEYRGENHG